MELIQPTPAQQEIIRRQLNEDVTTRDQSVEIIKEWLSQQPHLPQQWDEHKILTFLRGTKFSLEKCKRKLDMYFTMRGAVPEFFTDRDISHPTMREVLQVGVAPTLPFVTPDKLHRITVFRALKDDFDLPDLAIAFKLALMIGDVRLEAERFGVAGDEYVVDASCANFSRFTQVNPVVIKKFLTCAQQAYPVKVKGVHLVKAPPVVDFLINWVKPFIKEKIRKRIHVHPDLESLHKMVPKECLPEEFGGTAGKCTDYMDQWVKTLEEWRPWFKEQEQIVADESKRPGKPTNYDDLFGVEGSFRQLSID